MIEVNLAAPQRITAELLDQKVIRTNGRVIGVAIDDSLMQPGEKQMLEDLIAAAFNDARAKADQVSGAEMERMQSGLGLPAGFKLPGM